MRKDSYTMSEGFEPSWSAAKKPPATSEEDGKLKAMFAQFFSAVKKVPVITFVYTVLIFFNHCAYGIAVNIVGATLVDISKIYEVPLNTVSNMVVANNAGYTAGALAGNLYKWINRQVALVIFSLFIGVTTYIVPYYGSVWLIFVALTINGIGCGAWDAANSVWLVDMWPVGAAAVLQIAQLMFGGGTTLAPLLAQNFVFGDETVDHDGRNLTVDIRKEYLITPYIVAGALQTIAPVCFTILFFTHRYRKDPEPPAVCPEVPSLSAKVDSNNNNSTQQLVSSKSLETVSVADSTNLSAEHVPWRKLKLVLCGICLAAEFSAENGYFYYCTSMFQYLEIRLSASEATKVTSAFGLSYTMGPLVTALVSLKLSPDVIITYHYVIVLTGTSIVYFFRQNITLLYVGSLIQGFGFSAMVPGINAFTERHFKFSDTVAAMYTFSSGIASLIIPFTLGQFFEQEPLLLIYMVVGLLATSIFFFVILKVWIFLSPNSGGPQKSARE